MIAPSLEGAKAGIPSALKTDFDSFRHGLA